MKSNISKLMLLSLAIVSLSACENMSNRNQRMLSGAAIGTGVGAAAGVATGGCVTCGAVIGAGVGTAAGALYDHNH